VTIGRPDAADEALARTVRREVGGIVAATARWCGDLALAEDAVADAVVEALANWRRHGVPPRPGGWLQLAARRNALDRLRRDERFRDRHALLVESPIVEPHEERGDGLGPDDDVLALVFACCHPSIGRPAQLALTLRAVIGLTTTEIARALLSTETTIAQRISRAKRKIVEAGIRLDVPATEALGVRLDEVLTVVYLTYNEGHLATRSPNRRDLADDALWLAAALSARFPDEAEVLGLHALLILLDAREASRWTPNGQLVRLAEQDRTKWDRQRVDDGIAMLERAGALRRPGRFQLQAAIAALHAEAPTYEATDWAQIVALYDLLGRHDRSAVVRLNRAVALSHLVPAADVLAEVDALRDELASYPYLHAIRGHLLRMMGRTFEAAAADAVARSLTTNPAETALLDERIARADDDDR
jgi:RNA polymerase sigma-70 factor (ECF subfamily)